MLAILPCLDSQELAKARRRELQIPPDRAAELGRSAVEAAERGYYVSAAGSRVEWAPLVRAARGKKVSIPPDAPLAGKAGGPGPVTRVRVANETTLGASRRLVESGLRPLALNFANGHVPGGGFLAGATAQEEVLCRSSALFATLVGDSMYAAHRERGGMDFTDWAIHSPDVPVFRTDEGVALDRPWLLSFITCAAPYAPELGQPGSGELLARRIHRLLSIAMACGYDTLVLGAWGCGAFKNDPARTAADFRRALEHDFRGVFSDVVFAITDWSPERRFLGPFRSAFSPGASAAP